MPLGSSYVHRWNELLKRLLGAKGGEPTEGVAPEIVASIEIERCPPELSRYKSEFLWAQTQQIAAGAGFPSIGFVINPAGSGMLTVVEGFRVVTGGGAAISVNKFIKNTLQSLSPNAQNVQPRDSRFGAKKGSTIVDQLNSVGAPPITTSQDEFNLAVSSFGPPNPGPEVVLAPGTELVIASAQNNVAFDISFWGRERPVEQTELN